MSLRPHDITVTVFDPSDTDRNGAPRLLMEANLYDIINVALGVFVRVPKGAKVTLSAPLPVFAEGASTPVLVLDVPGDD